MISHNELLQYNYTSTIVDKVLTRLDDLVKNFQVQGYKNISIAISDGQTTTAPLSLQTVTNIANDQQYNDVLMYPHVYSNTAVKTELVTKLKSILTDLGYPYVDIQEIQDARHGNTIKVTIGW
jgi:hypothetical protein